MDRLEAVNPQPALDTLTFLEASMSTLHSSTPFPADVDRGAFGHWLSGFTDGEGCFELRFVKDQPSHRIHPNPTACFSITLRIDDLDILGQIRSYLGVGSIYDCLPRNSARRAANYTVSNTADLFGAIIPQFEAYPLRAKKRGDFDIWKLGVSLMHQILVRRRVYRSGGRKGYFPKWSDAERLEYDAIRIALKRNREFRDVVPASPARPHQTQLWADVP